MNFLTMGDAAYFSSIAMSVLQVKKYHPEAKFVVYDWGLSDVQREYLTNIGGAIIEDWTSKFINDPLEDNWFSAVSRRARATKKKIGVFRWLNSGVKELITSRNRRREWLYAQKPYCMLDWAKKSNEPFIFLDGDAFIISRIDGVDNSYDLGVTLRREAEIDFQFGYCHVLNSGVIFFNGVGNRNAQVIREWIKSMKAGKSECYSDQTSLTRLIYPKKVPCSVGEVVEVIMQDFTFTVKILSCEEYNYNWVEEGVDPSVNKIIHFKGGRHSSQRFQELVTPLGLLEQLHKVLRLEGV